MATNQEMVDLYIAAEQDVLAGKSVQFQGRTLSMEDLDSIRRGRKEWQRRLKIENDHAKGKTKNHARATF